MNAETSWQSWLGSQGAAVPGPYPVSQAAIGYLAEALEDERLAARLHAGEAVQAPPSFVTIASRVPNWRPADAHGANHFMRAMLVPLPVDSSVNTAIEQHYFQPLFCGDIVATSSTITAITPKRTRLGEGFFVTEEIEHRTQLGTVVAKTTNTMFRFRRGPQSSDGPRVVSVRPAESALQVPDGHVGLLSVPMPITMTRLVVGAGAVRDFSPLHHDVDAARAAGHATAFLSYSFQLALAVKALTGWVGDDSRITRLKLNLQTPVYLGRTVICRGTAPLDRRQACSLPFVLATEDGVCTMGVADIAEVKNI
jgi:acyl dehydratase